ncbi:molybdopterin-guanine dinucleotide biosynthesis protein A [Flaviramulus basaltis]|uniref:Probable molybdenum cofactor guanylyltransferase n=1 Tax=Flaviramulus basaltis TaxID=369401 RepID=A0A1K2IPW1_9FLAO|nr:molybdenum cofactor guanylyltransferase [Flaviramulus basaltis]SFZ94465.1 molybdopterin-guanine dinucleotide biosynthesis protein A [Flaviramulus basaltis]
MIDKKDITGIILAGGKSSRMGTDKGFLMLNGKTFIQHSIDALNPLVSKIIIVSNNEDYNQFGAKRINDVFENSGPIAGIYSGLIQSETAYNLVLSCDIPLINSNVLKKLIDGIDNTSEVIQIESNGKTMPLIALYKNSCEHIFYELLQKGEKRLQYAVSQCKVKTITLDNKFDFLTTNVNTKEELKELKNAYNY